MRRAGFWRGVMGVLAAQGMAPVWAWAGQPVGASPGEAPARVPRFFDPDTGRDLRRYPPDPRVDYHHMRLEIDIPDMNEPAFTAVQTLTFVPVGRPLATLVLDAALLEIRAVECEGHGVAYEHDGFRLTVHFEPPVPVARPVRLTTTYRVHDPPRGLVWTLGSPAWPGRAPQLHTQGQPEDNRFWFPCHDFPNERLTTELIVTVPAGFVVSSNGRAVESGRPAGAGRARWHFVQDQPHVNYLVSLVVGKFDVVDVASSQGRHRRRIPMPVYVPPGRGPDVMRTYGRTPEMVALFERLLDEPYPWDRYAQLVVWNFGAGGMENTAATTMHDTAILSPEAAAVTDIEGLIAHELAHQWFGDLLTCRSWPHIWLNEGFATYLATVWFEHRGGRPDADTYFARMLESFDAVIAADRADAPYQPAMVSRDYRDPWETFSWAANPYPKGAAILHMLRERLGDELFYRALAEYVDRFRLGLVETDQFRRSVEESTGEALEAFFAQWCDRPGVPDLRVEPGWEAQSRELVVRVEQRQRIDGDNPAYEFDLPVHVEVAETWDGGRRGAASGPATVRAVVPVRGRQSETRVALPGEPIMVAIDPRLTVLAKMEVRQPLERWLAQAARGPTSASRIVAVRALGADGSEAARAALAGLAGKTSEHSAVRAEACAALGACRDGEALAMLAARAPVEPDVRLALIRAVATCAAALETSTDHSSDAGRIRTRLGDVLALHAQRDRSFQVRAAAVRGLGALRRAEHLRLLLAAADAESQHDAVRQAALEALVAFDAPEGLPVAIRYALPGTLSRTRATAIRAVKALARHDREAAYRVLTTVLFDRERRAWEAAGQALAELGDVRAVGVLDRLAEDLRDPADREQMAQWKAQILARPRSEGGGQP